MQPDQTLLILGASGDLTERFLLAALGRLLEAEPERRITLIGSSRRDNPEWQGLVAETLGQASGPAIEHTVQTTRWVAADATKPGDWQALLDGISGALSIYFAVGQQIAQRTVEALAEVELPPGTRLIMEKPFGQGAESAAALNEQLTELVGAENVFRVDHFLAMPVVTSMSALRFTNPLLGGAWHCEQIEQVNIVWDEALGLAGRAGFYDDAGALRDMLQSHLLLVLAHVIMGRPVDEEDEPDALTEAVQSLRVLDDEPGAVRRARWTAGTIAGQEAVGYAEEEGVDPAKQTETLVQLLLTSDRDDWRGVPLLLRSGKGQGANRRHVEVVFRVPHDAPDGLPQAAPNRLVFQILTGDTELHLNSADPNEPSTPAPLQLSGCYYRPAGVESDDPAEVIEAAEAAVYARVLQAALDGDESLSVPADAAVACWELVDPVLADFAADRIALEEYPAGSMGPDGWLP